MPSPPGVAIVVVPWKLKVPLGELVTRMPSAVEPVMLVAPVTVKLPVTVSRIRPLVGLLVEVRSVRVMAVVRGSMLTAAPKA